jgi:catechol 2,3-dioxygenase-like lactoylglutathione lyase family enzyme
MGLFGLSHATISVPSLQTASHFYSDFGLVNPARGTFRATSGSELRVVEGERRGLLELGIWTDDADDLSRAMHTAGVSDASSAAHSGAVRLRDPVTRLPVVLSLGARPSGSEEGTSEHHLPNDRASAVRRRGTLGPRRLGHVVIGSPDREATSRFLSETMGMRVTEHRSGVMTFLRCDTDHHNIAVVSSKTYFLHHTSWEVADIDEVLKGGQRLVGVDPARNLWGPGRHFYGSNYFWYFTDPAGMFAEYYSDMDEITDDEVWAMRTAGEQGGTHVWGPPHPHAFRELAEAPDLVAFGA